MSRFRISSSISSSEKNDDLVGVPLSVVPPHTGDILRFDGQEWGPATVDVEPDDELQQRLTLAEQKADASLATVNSLSESVTLLGDRDASKLVGFPIVNGAQPGQVLQYSSDGGGLWVPHTITTHGSQLQALDTKVQGHTGRLDAVEGKHAMLETDVTTLKIVGAKANSLQGTPIDIQPPTEGQVLKYEGGKWVAGNDAVTDITGVQADVGTIQTDIGTIQTDVDALKVQEHDAVKLQGVVVDGATPTEGQVLKYEGGKWVAGNDAVTDITGVQADIGTIQDQVNHLSDDIALLGDRDASKLVGFPIVNGAQPGQVLQYSSDEGGMWMPHTITTDDSQLQALDTKVQGHTRRLDAVEGKQSLLETDVATLKIVGAKANSLQGTPIDIQPPTKGQVLRYTGTAWTASDDVGTDTTALSNRIDSVENEVTGVHSSVDCLRSTVLYKTTVDSGGWVNIPTVGVPTRRLVKILSANSSSIEFINGSRPLGAILTLVFDVAGVTMSVVDEENIVAGDQDILVKTPFVSSVGSSITFVRVNSSTWKEESRQSLYPTYFLLDASTEVVSLDQRVTAVEDEVSTLKTQAHDAVKLQGVAVDGAAPTEGQVLKYTGTTWSATDEAGADLTSVQEDIASNSNSITSLQTTVNLLTQQEHDAVKLNGVVVEAPTPVIGQLLRYNGEKWVAGNDAVTFENFDSLKSDVNTLKLQGVVVDGATPTEGQVLKYEGGKWVAGNDAVTDITGVQADIGTIQTDVDALKVQEHDAVKLQGVAVDDAAPTEGQVLKYTGGKWAPGIEAAADAQSAVESLRSTVLYQTTVSADGGGMGTISFPVGGFGTHTRMLFKILSAESNTVVRMDGARVGDKVTLVFDVGGVSIMSTGTFVNSLYTNTPFVSAIGSSITFVLVESTQGFNIYWKEESRQDLFPTYFLLDAAGNFDSLQTDVDALKVQEHDAVKLQGEVVDDAAPTEGQVLKYTGGKWAPGNDADTDITGVQADVSTIQADVDALKAKYFNVTEYGAVSDKTTDATSAFQAAVDACVAAGGGTVYVPAGDYLLSGTVHISSGIRLIGEGYNSAPFCLNGSINYDSKGTVIYVPSSSTGATFKLHNRCSIGRLSFFYPDQVLSGTPVAHPASIASNPNAQKSTIHDIFFANAYVGIDLSKNHESFTVKDVAGYCISRGVIVGSCTDVDRLINVQLNQNNFFGGSIPSSSISEWTSNNGVAFELLRADWVMLSKCFAWGYAKGVLLKHQDLGTDVNNAGSASFLIDQCGLDACGICIHNEDSEAYGQITNCLMTAFYPDWTNGLVQSDRDATAITWNPKQNPAFSDVLVSGCRFWGTAGSCIILNDYSKQAKIVHNECHEWGLKATDVRNSFCVSVSGDHTSDVIIANNVIDCRNQAYTRGIYVDGVQRVTIESNTIKNTAASQGGLDAVAIIGASKNIAVKNNLFSNIAPAQPVVVSVSPKTGTNIVKGNIDDLPEGLNVRMADVKSHELTPGYTYDILICSGDLPDEGDGAYIRTITDYYVGRQLTLVFKAGILPLVRTVQNPNISEIRSMIDDDPNAPPTDVQARSIRLVHTGEYWQVVSVA